MVTRSEQLFSRSYSTPETSTLVNANFADNAPWQDHSLLNKTPNLQRWYRNVSRAWWSALGISPIDSSDLLAKIAANELSRSSALLDTVTDYRPGVWSYEWLRFSVQQANLGRYLSASIAACIADYPHIRQDTLRLKSQPLVDHYYAKAMAETDCVSQFSRVSVSVAEGEVCGYLHLPHASGCVPLVVCLADWAQLYPEWFYFYQQHLAAEKIGLLVVEFAGNHSHINLHWSNQPAQAFQVLLDKVKELPTILSTKIAMLADRFSVPVAVKLALLNPQTIRHLVCIDPAIDQIFVDRQRHQHLPQVIQDGVASFLDGYTHEWDLIYGQLQNLSLKRQGLLKRDSWPGDMLVVSHRHSLLANRQEIKALAAIADNSECAWLKGASFTEQRIRALELCANWLKIRLNCE